MMILGTNLRAAYPFLLLVSSMTMGCDDAERRALRVLADDTGSALRRECQTSRTVSNPSLLGRQGSQARPLAELSRVAQSGEDRPAS